MIMAARKVIGSEGRRERKDPMIYLDNAATTYPKPKAVYGATIKCMKRCGGNPGRSGHTLSLRAAEKVYKTREALSDHFHLAVPENVVFTLNTSYALNLALRSVLKSGDHVITSDIEHNSVSRPLAADTTVTVSRFDAFLPEEELLSAIEGMITPKTKVLVACHACNILPIVLPLAKIGALLKKHGVLFIVDGAQSAGIYDIDMQRDGISMLCIPGHKSLYGPQGCGALLVSADIPPTALSPVIAGGNGVYSGQLFMPDFLPERFEAGTLPTPAIAGLLEGVRFISGLGHGYARQHDEYLSGLLLAYLQNDSRYTVYSEKKGSVVLFNAKGISGDEIADRLDEAGICVRSGLHCSPLAHRKIGTDPIGAVRVSFGVFNEKKDVDKLITALHKAV